MTLFALIVFLQCLFYGFLGPDEHHILFINEKDTAGISQILEIVQYHNFIPRSTFMELKDHTIVVLFLLFCGNCLNCPFKSNKKLYAWHTVSKMCKLDSALTLVLSTFSCPIPNGFFSRCAAYCAFSVEAEFASCLIHVRDIF